MLRALTIALAISILGLVGGSEAQGTTASPQQVSLDRGFRETRFHIPTRFSLQFRDQAIASEQACRGFATPAPVHLTYNGSDAILGFRLLRLGASWDPREWDSLVLMVRFPDGRFACGADVVSLSEAMPGDHQIWIVAEPQFQSLLAGGAEVLVTELIVPETIDPRAMEQEARETEALLRALQAQTPH
ncbi:hypothetical protein [Maricaulis sp. CAU 1757]